MDMKKEINPHQRSYSVMAVPSELEQHRKNKQNNPSNNLVIPWHIEMYQKYGYEPKLTNPSYFGPYLLLQTLGEGEFAKVKAAVHVQTNQEVAIKLMRKDHIKQASLETKLEREISILKTVCHPNIVKLFEVLTIKNYIGIVLQRAAGGELFDYILKHHYLQENEAKRLFSQLISGVDYMHQKLIVHRDLKLENLLLSKDRDIIITDFGFANRFLIAKEDYLMTTSCGSPCYAAPELVINQNDENNNNNSNNNNTNYVGTAADIWSCGVILFAMLCGYLPFDDDPTNPQGANINALYKYIISTPLEIPKTISLDATHLLRRMLVPDPKKRCKMEELKNHPWLNDHREILSKSLHELEEEEEKGEYHYYPYRLDSSAYQVRQALYNNNTTTSIINDTRTMLPKLPRESAMNQEKQTTAICTTEKNVFHSFTKKPKKPIKEEEKFFSTLYQRYLANSQTNTTTTSATATATTNNNKNNNNSNHINNNNKNNKNDSNRRSMFNSSSSKIPNRSQSVKQSSTLPPSTRRQRMKSENYTSSSGSSSSSCTRQDAHPSSLFPILPSVSEQTTVASNTSNKTKSKGQKIIDWFKRVNNRPPNSQSTRLPIHSYYKKEQSSTIKGRKDERPSSQVSNNPIRVMSIGKPFGSYAADFNDTKLRVHRGAVDQDALTSRAPNEVLQSIKESLTMMGIEMKRCRDYKIKCLRPARLVLQQSSTRMRKMSTVIVPPFKSFFTDKTATTTTTTTTTNKASATTAAATTSHVLYGEQGIDTGEEVQFNVELSKIENLPGLYVVDIRRSRGNIWAFKFLYHTLLDLLDLSKKGQGGMAYMAHRRMTDEPNVEDNRISYMTNSSSGSSIMVFEET
ncbi:kinase-like domain-containing protein [Cokeromyces recurvatus]|uniref:kinase-like domain-containing protein n=1 Tax=Cokeromyces recurvatus TaxID=90255 RepID=UPI002220CFFB|nr:kinase-like domain-containing protein [Cokeromyces recurvatus]KAI7900994.1 kinase-like domain-containing protein [Cokeromyces recurvatus]